MRDGFSEDGYIIDQDRFAAYPYRTMSSDINGCGWIAAFDLRRALGQDADFDEVRREMDDMFTLRVPGPTTMKVMRRYLTKYVPGYTLTHGLVPTLEAAERSRAGILRYLEQRVPHFVTFVRQEDGLCRFFNVADGLEDYIAPIGEFMNTRCCFGPVHGILVE